MGAVMNFLKKTPVLPAYLFAKKTAKKIKKFYMLRMEFPQAYNKNRNKPIEEDKVVFIEIRHGQITNSFQELYDMLTKEYNFRVHCHFLRVNFVSSAEHRRRCCEMLEDMATAKYVFVNDGTYALGCIKKRPETVLVQTWHGCGAFKKFGHSTAELIFGDSLKDMLKYPTHKNYSYVTVSSPEVIWAYEEAMNLKDQPGTVVATGSSRTDIFYRPEFIEAAKEKLHKILPEADGKKVLLYAPTFRGRVAKARTPNMLNIQKFYENFKDEYVLLFKHHPLVEKPPVIGDAYKDFAMDVTKHMSIEELICVSDICISDYSSLVFEFSLFEKPMIFYSYDLDEYFDWRGFYYDYFELAPGPVFTTNREMIDYIKHIDERFDRQRVIDFRNKFMSSCDGHATERILETAMGKEVLAKYRKEEPLTGSFYQIPDCKELFSTKKARWALLDQVAAKAPAMYQAAVAAPVKKGKVLFVQQDEQKEGIIWKKLTKAVNKNMEDAEIVTMAPALSDEFYRAAAEAEFIVLQKTCPFIQAVTLRPETKLMQLDAPSWPVKKIGYNSDAYVSRYEQEEYEKIPLHGKYAMTAVNSKENKQSVAEGYGITPEECRITGSIRTDRIMDGGRRKEILEKLEAGLANGYPALNGRKILVYMPKDRYRLTSPNRHVLLDSQELFESLADDYVILYHFDVPKKGRSKISKYFQKSMVDVTEHFTAEELLTVADGVIGDYRPEILDYAATGRPTYFYVPDKNLYDMEKICGYSHPELLPGVEIDSAEDLIEKLKNPESCDWSNQEEYCSRYAERSDGKACNRIAGWMAKHRLED